MRDDPVNHTVVPSSLGGLLLTSDGTALTGLYLEPHAARAPANDRGHREDHILRSATDQLSAYFTGELSQFDLPLALSGTTFQQRVWHALLTVPFGETISYAELARRAGVPGSARAVGAAVGRNPISIIVPCHRIIGSNGNLTGYGGGLPRKQWLLEHEQIVQDKLSKAV